MSEPPHPGSESVTVRDVIAKFEVDGHHGQFGAREGGMVMCFSCRQESDACDTPVTAIHRLEGASDPADMLAVAALTCPRCGARGTVVLNFGPEATPEDHDVLRHLDDQRQSEGTDPVES